MLGAAISVIGLLAGCTTETRDTDIKLIDVGQVKSLMDRQARGQPNQLLLIDPRPTKAFDAAHIPGANNLLLPRVDPKADRDPALMDKGLIVVYGNNPASASARGMTKRLMAVGYKGVRFFAGGLEEWQSRGYPVEPPQAPATSTAPQSPGPSAD